MVDCERYARDTNDLTANQAHNLLCIAYMCIRLEQPTIHAHRAQPELHSAAGDVTHAVT